MDDEASFDIGTGEYHLKVSVRFEDTDDDKPNIQYSQTFGRPSVLVLSFVNWKNPLGTSIKSPSVVAEWPGMLMLAVLATHWRVGNVNRIDLAFLNELGSHRLGQKVAANAAVS